MPNATLDSYVYTTITLPANAIQSGFVVNVRKAAVDAYPADAYLHWVFLDRVSLDVGWMEIQQQSLLN